MILIIVACEPVKVLHIYRLILILSWAGFWGLKTVNLIFDSSLLSVFWNYNFKNNLTCIFQFALDGKWTPDILSASWCSAISGPNCVFDSMAHILSEYYTCYIYRFSYLMSKVSKIAITAIHFWCIQDSFCYIKCLRSCIYQKCCMHIHRQYLGPQWRYSLWVFISLKK